MTENNDQDVTGKKKNMRCASCNYVFFTGRVPVLCPFCGKEKTLIDNSEGGAQKILEEVNKWGDDRNKANF